MYVSCGWFFRFTGRSSVRVAARTNLYTRLEPWQKKKEKKKEKKSIFFFMHGICMPSAFAEAVTVRARCMRMRLEPHV